jgi:FtsZ-binding cell division protein ZapB
VSNNPAKKLKLEMSSIDEIAKMIEQDGKDMEQLIVALQEEKNKMRTEIKNWKDKLKD